MKLLKKMIGYNIVPTFDAEEKAVFFDRSTKAVFVNLSRWRDLRYVDFLSVPLGLSSTFCFMMVWPLFNTINGLCLCQATYLLKKWKI